MSRTKKKQKHTLHKASKEYSPSIKCMAVGRIKMVGHSYIYLPVLYPHEMAILNDEGAEQADHAPYC